MEKVELKPCPFCGGEAKLFQDEWVSEPDNFFARCDPCDLIRDQAHCVTREAAIEAWNTRANDEEIARGQAAMWLLASILKAKSAFESGDRNTAGVDPDAWEEAARSILGEPS